MMTRKKHMGRLLKVSVAWGLFWTGGLPDYYQQYSALFMFFFDIAILPPIIYLVFRSVKKTDPAHIFMECFWWAFYISVPLFVFDLVYCGFLLGTGLNFLIDYWYLTVYYILPWPLFLTMGHFLQKRLTAA